MRTRDYVFSLDIGTRTVIGIVGEYRGDTLNILGIEKLEHKKRAMYDGQIHDINSVAEVANRVKESLEEQTGISLKRVSIAAAGRSLETVRSKVTVETDISKELDKRDIRSAELEAVQLAQRELDGTSKARNREEKDKYHCVGHSVTKSYLDDVQIDNLEGHRGNTITIEVIATFLPYTVMNSLYSVMDRIGLEVESMTLEPIAAMEVAIKKDLRLLNLVLVDVGAGTSDIAITKEGTVLSYDMVPIAGDEITEAIITKYLLDYDEAERVKTSLCFDEEIAYTDILGIGSKRASVDIVSDIDESIDRLASSIAERILDINEKSPSAVFMIGGGAQIPKLGEKLAEKVGLPKERVVLRDTSIIEGVENIDGNLLKSDGITPIGIALNSAKSSYKNFIEVEANGNWVKLFNSGLTKVLDLMLTIGYNPRNLIPKRGKGLSYYLNGDEKKLLGDVGENAEITVNGQVVDLEYGLEDGDIVKIKSATEGKSATATLRDLVDLEKHIVLNGEKKYLIRSLRVNGEYKSEDYRIEENDRIELDQIRSVEELYGEYGIGAGVELFNDMGKLDGGHIIESGESIYYDRSSIPNIFQESDVTSDEVEEVPDEPEAEVQKKQAYIGLDEFTNKFNSSKPRVKRELNILVNGENIRIVHDKSDFNFVDVFDYIDFDTSELKGKLNLYINGEKAEYLKPIRSGDELKIYWSDVD